MQKSTSIMTAKFLTQLFTNKPVTAKKNFSFFTRSLVILSLLVTVVFSSLRAQYSNVLVTGFNDDIVANGVGASNTVSTGTLPGVSQPTICVDGNTPTAYALIDATYKWYSGSTAPTCFLPAGGVIPSALTSGLSYQLQSYSANNALTVVSNTYSGSVFPTSGSVSLVTPSSYGNLYVLYETVLNTAGPAVSATVTFTDNSTQVFANNTVVNWFTATNVAYTPSISRAANTAPGAAGACSTGPYLFQMTLPLSAANLTKVVQSVSFSWSAATGSTASTVDYLHVMAVGGLPTCVQPADGPTSLLQGATTTSSIAASWTAAGSSPTGYLSVIYPTGATPVLPANGTTYTTGQSLGTGKVIQASAALSATASGLTGGTTYDIYVYSYNSAATCGGPIYNTANQLVGTMATSACGGLAGGTYSVGPMGTYLSLTGPSGALTAISMGITGPVILELQSTYLSTVETFPITFPSNPCIGSVNNVTIRPVLGASALSITSANAVGTINFNAGNYITIDGRPGGAGTTSQLTIANTNAGASYAINFTGDASNNTVKYCTVTSRNNVATSGTIVFGTGTVTGNDNNTIDNCSIQDDGIGNPVNGIYSLGTSAAIDNSNNIISNNNISNYFSATLVSSGILLTSTGNSAWTIINNRLFQTVTRVYTAAQTHNGISVQTGSGYTITGNIIGFANAAGTGTTNIIGNTVTFAGFPAAYVAAGTANATRYIAINCAFTAGAAVSSLQNNTIAGFALYTSSGASTTNGIFCGINVVSGNANIGTVTGNTIGSTSGLGSIYAACTTSGGAVVGIFATSTNTVNIQNNTIGGVDAVGTTATLSGGFTGIDAAGAAGNIIESNNTTGNTTADNIRVGYTLSGTNLSNAGTLTSTTGAGAIVGIRSTATGNGYAASNNILRGWVTSGTVTTVTGIISSGTMTGTNAITVNANAVGTAGLGWIRYAFANSGTLTGISVANTVATIHSLQTNDFQGIVYSVAGSGSHTYINFTGGTAAGDVTNINTNTFTNLNVNTTGSVTFFAHSYTVGAGGTQNINTNSIVTAFNKGGAGGTVTIFTSGASTVAAAAVSHSNNNFSNITVTGATTITGFSSTDGLSTITYNRIVNGNTFNNWTGGTNAITVMTYSYWGGTGSTLSNNIITNITGQGAITGISINSSGNNGNPLTIGSNTITNLTSTGTGGAVTGITCSNTSPIVNINNNAISALSSTASAVIGIAVTGATATNVVKNSICNLSGSNAGSTVNGIMVSGGTTVTCYNNRLGDLRATIASAANPINGINITGGTTLNVYYNTVNLSATSTGAVFGSSAVSAATGATVNLRNNIFVNNSTPNTTGLTVAYRRSSTTLTSYASSSNNNLFYAGTPGANNLIYTDGTNSDQTLLAYKSRVNPRDGASVSQNPAFLSITCGNGNFLKIDPAVPNLIEGSGAAISGITDDFDGDTRSATTPDIGSDEFTGTALSVVVINSVSISPTGNLCVAASRAVTANITAGGTNITSVTLNYSFNGGTITSIAMTGGNPAAGQTSNWTGTIPVATPSNATVTWSVTAIDAVTSKNTAGTSYADEPLTGVTATALVSPAAICAGSPASLSVTLSKGGTATLGAGASTTTTSGTSSGNSVSPFSHYYGGYKAQYLIKATELAGFNAGNITGLAFNVTTAGITYNSFTISMANTLVTALTTTHITSGLTQVYTANYTPATGINNIPFTTPFAWDGTSNIVIQICWSNNNGGGVAAEVKYDATSFASMAYTRTDNVTPATICSNTSGTTQNNRPQIVLAINSAPTPTAFSWSDGSTVVGTTNPLTVNPTTNTSYTATVTAGGCTINSNAVTVNVTALPASPIPTNSTQCGTGVPAAFVTSGFNSGTTVNFRWYDAQTGGNLLQTGGASFAGSISTSTTFWVSESNATCQSARVQVIASVNPPDLIQAAVDNNNPCQNTAISLSAAKTTFINNNNYTYSWTASPVTGSGLSGATGGNPLSVTPTAAGTYVYTVTATDLVQGCVTTSNVSVTVKAPPSITTSTATPSTVCAGASVALAATSFASGNSDRFSEPFESYPVATFTTSGTGVTWTGSNYFIQGAHSVENTYAASSDGSLQMSNNVSLVGAVNPKLLFSHICALENGFDYGRIEYSIDGGVNWLGIPATAYLGSGTLAPNVSPSIGFQANSYADWNTQFSSSTSTYPAAPATSLWKTETINLSAYNSASTFRIRFRVTSDGSVQYPGWKIDNVRITTDAVEVTNSLNWVWNPGALAGANVTVNPVTTTTYTVTATDPATTCSNTAMVTVNVNPLPAQPAGNNGDDQCGTGITNASVSSNTIPAPPSPIFKWYLVPTGGTAVQTGTSTTYQTAISMTTDFYVSEISAAGCEGPRVHITTIVGSPDPITVSASPLTVCLGGSTSIAATYSPEFNSFATFTLTVNNQTGSGITNPVTLTANGTGDGSVPYTITPTAVGTYIYTITAYDPDKFCTSVNTVTVSVNPVPVITSASASPATICAGASSTLTALTGSSSQTTLQIGSGTASVGSSTTNGAFYGSYYGNGHAQILIKASELSALGFLAGNLTALSIDVSALGGGAVQTLNNFTIKLASVSTATSAISTFQSPTFTTVYGPSNYTPVVGTNSHSFIAPYAWDGVSNIIVDYCFTSGVTGTVSSVQNTVTTTSFGSFVNHQVDGSAATECTVTTITNATSVRPNIKFTGLVGNSGPGAYSWTWNPGNLSGNVVIVNPLVTTTYTATATLNGCSANSSPVTVTVNQLPNNPVATNSIQCGIGIPPASVATGGGGGSGIFNWYASATGGTALQSGSSTTYTTSISTTTTFYVSENGTNGCEGLRTPVTATVTTPPAVNTAGSTTSVCLNGTVTLKATSSESNYLYTWTANPGTGSGISGSLAGSAPGTSTNTITPTLVGTYTYTVTATENINNCTATATVVATVNPNPVVSNASANPTTVCSGGSVTLTGQPQFANVPVTGYNIDIVANGTGAVSASTTGDFDNLWTLVAPDWNFNGSCAAVAFSLPATGKVPANSGIASGLVYSLQPYSGLNDLRIPATGTGTIGSGTLNVTTPTNMKTIYLLYGAGNGPITSGITVTVTFTDATNQVFSNLTATDWFTSANAAIGSIGRVNRTTTPACATTTSGGPYLFDMSLALNAANYSKLVQSIKIDKTITTGIMNILGVGMETPPDAGIITWQWNPGGFTGNTVIVNPTTTTTYTATATNQSTGCSSVSAPVTVTVTPVAASASANPSVPVCAGTSVTLNANPTGGAPFTYSWSNGTSVVGTTNPLTVTPTVTTTYTVTVMDACSNSITSAVTVTVNPLPTVAVTPTTATFCSPGTGVTLTASGASTYAWTPSAGLSATTGATVIASPTTATTYTVTGTDANGCVNTATTVISVSATPTATATASPTTLCAGSPLSLTASASVPATGYTVGSIPVSIETPGGTPTVLANGGTTVTPFTAGNTTTLDDVYWNNISLPFSFGFFGNTYSAVRISSNGTVQFGPLSSGTGTTGNYSWVPQTIPTSGGNLDNFIAGPWTDLDLSSTPYGKLQYYVNGIAPNRKFVVSYEAVHAYLSSDNNTSQIILNENGTIDVLLLGGGFTSTASKAIGVENSTGSLGTAPPGRNLGTWTTLADEAWRFSPVVQSFTYAWTGPNSFTSTLQNPVIANPDISASGIYHVIATNPSTGCSSLTANTAAVIVNPRPTGVISGSGTYCNGANTATMLSIAVTGAGPWSGTITNGTTTTPFSGSTSPISVTVTPTATTTYTIVTLNGSACSSIAADLSGSATITINPRPTGVISGSGTYCNGANTATVLSIAVTGAGPWSGTLSDGTTFSGSTSPISVTVTPTATTTYTIATLVGSACSSIAADLSGSATVTVNPRPTGVISGSGTYCNGANTATVLSIAVTGAGPWSGTLSNGATFSGSTSPISVTVTPTTTTTYTIATLNGAQCSAIAADLSGSATVTINPRPTGVISGSGTYCNGANTATVLSIAVTGAGPWSGTITDGTNTTPFSGSSSPISVTVTPTATTTYTIATLNGAQCSAIAADLSGSATVTINPRPTGVISGSGTYCNGANTATVLSIAVTGAGPWSGTLSDGTTFSGSTSPISVTVTPTATTTYTIATLNGSACSSIAADLSGSATVTINPRPTGVISGSGTYCNGANTSTVLSIAVTGAGPWSGTLSDGTTFSGSTSPISVTVTPTVTTTYTIATLNGAQCSAIAADLSGSATVTINPRPTGIISGSGTYCNGANTATVLSIAVTGSGPWSGTLSDGTTFSGASSPISVTVTPTTTTTYTIATLVGSACSSIAADLSGSATVTINPRPTAVISGSGTYCNGANTATVLSIAVTGSGPWSGTLSNGASFSGSTSPISVTVTPIATTTYTIATLNGSACSSIAADLSGSATVTINPRPTGVISGSGTYCNGANTATVLSIAVTGAGPWSGTLSNGATFSGSTSPISVTVTPTVTTTYTIATLVGSACSSIAADLSGSATVTINPRPTGVISGSGTYCSGANTATVLSIAVTGAGPWSGTLSDGTTFSGSTSPISVTVTPTTTTTYTIATLVGSACSSIAADLSGSATVTVNPLAANVTATVSQPTCTVATGTITVTAPLGSGTTYSLDGGTYQGSVTFSGVAPGTHSLTAQTSSGCFSPASTSVTVNPQPFTPSAPTVTGIVNVCPYVGTGQHVTYTANAAGATSYNWTIPPSNVTIFSGQGTNTLVLIFNNGFSQQGNQQIRVTATSACGTSAQTLYVLVAQYPTTPNPITGPTNICPLIGTTTTATYSIPASPAAISYNWTVPGLTITAAQGQNTTSITFTYPAGYTASGPITVVAANNCGSSGTRSLTLSAQPASQPGLITGPSNVCENIAPNGTAATYSITPVSGATSYTWTVSGVSSFTGQGTASISFTYPAGYTTGSVSVTATNGCGTGSARTLAISRLNPATPSNIDVINTSPCPNRQYTYTLASMPANATSIQWTIPANGSYVSGQGSTSITVSYPATSVNGTVTAQAINNCGVSTIRSVAVKLPACPSGFARVDESFTKGTVASAESMEVKIFPNPTVSDFKLEVLTAGKEEINVRVLNDQGKLFKTFKVMPYQTIALGAELKAGAYLVEVRQGREVRTTKVIKF